MSKNSPKKRLSTFRNWLATVKPVKSNPKKRKNEKNTSKYRVTTKS